MTGDTSGAAALDGATTVLLLAPDVHGASLDACAKSLRRLDDQIDRAVAATVARSPAEWVEAWERQPGTRTAAITCIDVDDDTRAAANSPDQPTDAAVEHVSNPGDMERLGRRISDVLQRADDDGERVGVVFHSLTDVLRHVDDQTAFRFVYTLGEVLRRVDGVAFFHLDPDAHDSEVVETFRLVCDAVVGAD